MPKSAHDRLLDALDDLGEADLKRFKRKLNEFPVKKGYKNIPKGRLEKADTEDLAELLISFYAEEYAEKVAIGVLEEINCKRQAEKLACLAGTSAAACRPTHRPIDVGANPETEEEHLPDAPGMHFIERHREELIRRTTHVEGVLDMLYGAVLDNEQYQKILFMKTSQDKMRELYMLLPSWNRFCKDRLYEALKVKQKYLIEDLEDGKR
ncbi:apoptosis-associated speck-like protein containing a CARD isoform X1 [Anolis sagrei]|uniref:apoptosis-associated speck-like protein containing a CARD isoform X1 n=1 Tax=Anolis sagrei TaxID=38937 RepID=UPI003520842A